MAGPSTGQIYEIRDRETLLGRSGEALINIDDSEVSRKHSMVLVDVDGLAKVVDLGSTNGTYVNGRRVEVEVLKDGDCLRLGARVTLRFAYDYEGVASFSEMPANGPPPATVTDFDSAVEPLNSTLDGLGKLYAERGDFEQAIEIYERELALRERQHGAGHPRVAAVFNNLGSVWRRKGDVERALVYHHNALDILRGHPDPRHWRARMRTHLWLATNYQDVNRTDRAQRNYRAALELCDAHAGSRTERAHVQFLLAQTIHSQDPGDPAARELAAAAQEALLADVEGPDALVDQVTDWLARTG